MADLTTPPLGRGISSGMGRGVGFSGLPISAADAAALAAYLTQPRLPAHPLTPLERWEAEALPWWEQRELGRAVDRACSPEAVRELLEERDQAAQAEDDDPFAGAVVRRGFKR